MHNLYRAKILTKIEKINAPVYITALFSNTLITFEISYEFYSNIKQWMAENIVWTLFKIILITSIILLFD